MTETPNIPDPPSPWTDDTADPGGRFSVLRRALWIVMSAGVLLFILCGVFSDYLVKWLWMRELDYAGIFWTILSVQWTMFGSAFVVAFLFIWLNARWAISAGSAPPQGRIVNSLAALVAAGIALFGAAAFATEWDTWLRFRHGGSFGQADPLFGADIGFYVFCLPFYELLQTAVMLVTAIALIITVTIYVLSASIYVLFAASKSARGRIEATGKATSHISALLLVLVANCGFGLYLEITTWYISLSASSMAPDGRRIM